MPDPIDALLVRLIALALHRGAATEEEIRRALAAFADTTASQEAVTIAESGPRRSPTEEKLTIVVPDAGPHTMHEPSERSAPAGPPARRVGKYEILEELGHGGMGVVYKGWHPALRRFYAIKALHPSDDGSSIAVQRLHKEAQALARLSHPGIVAVQDIWDEDGRTFLAMEFVDGVTLDRLLHSMAGRVTEVDPNFHAAGDPEAWPGRKRSTGFAPVEAVRIVREVAEAIHYAHGMGVIHRDLKPANVIRDATGRVKVMDFGLAKIVEAGTTRLTKTGSIMGTPAYISPEQVDIGMEAVNAQTDVYQIGAILYELLTGRLPYEGDEPMEVLLHISRDDPVAPRRINPAIARDAETICLTAMARERTKRYATARDLAEDCRRFLEGEAILARREGRLAKGLRWVRRRRAVSAAAAALLVTVIVIGLATGLAVRSAHERTRLEAEVLAGLRAISRTDLVATLLVRRAGGRMDDAAQAFLGPSEAAVADAVARAPELAEPHYHLGRLYRALLRFDSALAEQEQALRKDHDFAAGLYERAILNALKYEKRADDLREEWLHEEGRRLARSGALEKGGGAGAEVRPPPSDRELAEKDAALTALGATIARDLTRLEALAARAQLAPGVLASARGIFAVYAGRDAERAGARAQLETALKEDPHLEEAFEALARLEQGRGDPAAAAQVYTRGLAVDRGYVPFWAGRAEMRGDLAVRAEARGADPEEWHRLAVEDRLQVIDLQPASAEALVRLANARNDWGVWKKNHGRDPVPLYEAAEADLSRGIERDARIADAWRLRAAVGANWGLWLDDHGQDAKEKIERALADFTRAIELEPDSSRDRMQRGEVRMNWGLLLKARGQDPEAIWQGAQEDFGKALELDPKSADAWRYRGSLRLNWGGWLAAIGKDPEAIYRDAGEDFRRALELQPAGAEILMAWAGLCSNWALARERRGGDPEPLYREAEARCAMMLQINPRLAEGFVFRGGLRTNRGQWLRDHGRDPSDAYRGAIADLDAAIALNAASPEPWLSRGLVYLNWGLAVSQAGVDPEAMYDKALADFDHSLAINAKDAEIWEERALLQVNRASWHAEHGKDAAAEYEAATRDYAKARELNPASAEVVLRLGDAYVNWGSFRETRGEDPTACYEQSLACFDDAIAKNPGSSEHWWRRAVARMNWGNYKMKHDQDPTPLYEQSLTDLRKAEELNPASPDLPMITAHLRMTWCMYLKVRNQPRDKLYEDAEADYAKALKMNGKIADVWMNRGRLRMNRAADVQERGENAEALWQSALADYDEALRLKPADADAFGLRAFLHFQRNEWALSVADFAAALQINPAKGPAYGPLFKQAQAKEAWRVLCAQGDARVDASDYAGGRAAYEQGLAEYAKAQAALPESARPPYGEAAREALVGTHYNLACALARLGGEVDAAFAELREAVRLGYADGKHMAEDADLEALHGDARWGELMGGMK